MYGTSTHWSDGENLNEEINVSYVHSLRFVGRSDLDVMPEDQAGRTYVRYPKSLSESAG